MYNFRFSLFFLLLDGNLHLMDLGIGNFLYLTGRFDLFTSLANGRDYIRAHEVYRLITSAFVHQELLHLIFNMYALYIIGMQVESFVGKYKFLLI